jgi:hypothetical protein
MVTKAETKYTTRRAVVADLRNGLFMNLYSCS